MSGELSIVNYSGSVPQSRADLDHDLRLPLGTLGELRSILDGHFPGLEWELQPSLVSLLQQNGSEIPKDWDADRIAECSKEKLSAHSHNAQHMITFYGLPIDDGEVIHYLLVEMHASGNPYPSLRKLCADQKWIAVGPNPDDDVVDFESAIEDWERWESS